MNLGFGVFDFGFSWRILLNSLIELGFSLNCGVDGLIDLAQLYISAMADTAGAVRRN